MPTPAAHRSDHRRQPGRRRQADRYRQEPDRHPVGDRGRRPAEDRPEFSLDTGGPFNDRAYFRGLTIRNVASPAI